MHRFVVFESDEKEKFRFEVNSDTAWVTMVDEMIGTHSSQETLKKIITKSSDDVLVEDALSYYNGNLTYKFLDSRKEFFDKINPNFSGMLRTSRPPAENVKKPGATRARRFRAAPSSRPYTKPATRALWALSRGIWKQPASNSMVPL